MDKIQVAMTGAGRRARQVHYPSLAKMEDVKITAICELKEDLMKTTAEEYGVEEQFTDHKLMLKKMDLDAVYIIMHPTFLDPLVTYCLKQGKNVLVEKPPGTRVDETKKWAELAEENDCKTMVSFQRRFHLCVMKAKRIVEKRGKIPYCLAAFHKYGEWKRYGDSLTFDVIHVVDLVRWLGGEVKNVSRLCGQLYSNKEGYLNFFSATLQFESGGIGILSSNRNAGGRALYCEMHGKGISAYCTISGKPGIDQLLVQIDNEPYENAKIIKNEELIESNAPRTHFDGSFQLNRHFIDCIKGDKQPLANFSDAVKTMEVIKEIHSGPRLSPIVDF
jgi:predicted dehydrogenase